MAVTRPAVESGHGTVDEDNINCICLSDDDDGGGVDRAQYTIDGVV